MFSSSIRLRALGRRGLLLAGALVFVATGLVAGLGAAHAAAPTVTSLSKRATTQCGHETLLINGSGFSLGSVSGGSVNFIDGAGTVTSPNVTWTSDTQVYAEIPAHIADTVQVTVTVNGPAGGTSSTSSSTTLTYLAQQPAVSAVSPTHGPVSGGNTVTVTGTCFVSAANLTSVNFGSLSSASISNVTENSLQVVAPAATSTTGVVDVTVTTVNSQTSAANAPNDQYTFVPAPTISGVSPVRGPVAGGQLVTITGTGFTATPATPTVTFGGTQAAGTTVVDAQHITATTPAHAAGAADVVVTNWDGQAATAGSAYTYVAAPTVTAVSPNHGQASSTSPVPVTVTGTGFFGGTGALDVSGVTFGPAAASIDGSYTATDTSIRVFMPSGQPLGTVDVRVTTTGGRSATSGADRFTFLADPPAITGLSPNEGPQGGGNTVTISGTNFQTGGGTTTVAFGVTNATSVTVVSSTSITAVAPAGTGHVSVTITEPDGQTATTGSPTSTYGYKYTQAPTVSAVSPTSGKAAGGDTITVTGTGFDGNTGFDLCGSSSDVTAVSFGSTPAASFSFVSCTQLQVVTPAGSGTQDVRVTTSGGQSATGAGDQYTFVPPPTISGVAPSRGSPAGGNSVTITGTGFTSSPNTPRVTFGGAPATGVVVNSPTSITATVPANPPGYVDVVLVNGDQDQQSGTLARGYAYAPSVTGLSSHGSYTGGGQPVVITGEGFIAGSTVNFGSTPVPAGNYTVDSGNQITVTSNPPHAPGTVDVTVTSNGVTSSTSGASQFTYLARPVVTGVAPARGPDAGGQRAVITGSGLYGSNVVNFGHGTLVTPGTDFTVDSDTQITVLHVPAWQSSYDGHTVDVVVQNGGNSSPTGSGDHYTYVDSPTVTGVAPSSGGVAGGGTATISGTNFDGGTGSSNISAVHFGTVAANLATLVFNTPSSITITVPAQGAGVVDVTVTTDGGTTATSPSDQYSYLPQVTGVAPARGPSAGGQQTVVTGSGFTGAGSVGFGSGLASTPGTDFRVDSDTQITVLRVPAWQSGTDPHTVDVVVNNNGTSSATGSADRYTYVDRPTVSAVAPSGGSTAGGNTVTVTGTGFDGGTGGSNITAVHFGSVPASLATLTYGSPTSFTIAAPAGAVGTVDVTVTTDGGTSATSSADQYSYSAAPGAPNAVTATRGDHQATVSWTAPSANGSPIDHYTVTPYVGSTAGTPVTTSATSIVVTGLTNGTTYTFGVTATNARGTSAAGTSNAVTPAGLPAAPAKPVATAGSLSATVAWTAPSANGSPIASYTVTASPGGAHTTVPGGQTSATVTGLANSTPYTFTVTATNAVGTGAASPASDPVTPLGFTQYHSISPLRVLDTRADSCVAPTPCTNETPLAAGETRLVDIAGPLHASGVRAVVVNITAVNPTAASFLSVWPSNLPKPNSAFLNWNAGDVTPNLVQVAVSPDGHIAMFSPSGTVDVVMDVAGYFVDASSSTAGLYDPVAPNRLLDTRNGAGPFGAGETRTLRVTGGSVPATGVAAVVLNVAVTNTTSGSNLVISPTGTARPNVANLNWVAGQTRSNRATVAVGTGGSVDIHNVAGSADVIVDIGGYYTDGTGSGTGYQYVPLAPVRVMETRDIPGVATPTGGHPGPLGDHETFELIVPGVGDGATRPARAFTANVAVAGTTTAGFLTAYDSSLTSEPNAADVNWAAGQVVSADLETKLGPDTGVKLGNHSGSTDVIVDLDGWYG